MAYTGRGKFVPIEGSGHGSSIATISTGGTDKRQTLPNRRPSYHNIDPPLDHNALGKAETLLKKCDVAAFIMEPIIYNLGAIVPEDEFMRGVRKLCTRYGIVVNPAKHLHVRLEDARKFADYLLTSEARSVIAKLGVDKYGEALFRPNRGRFESWPIAVAL